MVVSEQNLIFGVMVVVSEENLIFGGGGGAGQWAKPHLGARGWW